MQIIPHSATPPLPLTPKPIHVSNLLSVVLLPSEHDYWTKGGRDIKFQCKK